MPQRTFSFVQLDVFTSRPLEGNQLAVFSDARGVDVPGFGEEAGEPPGRHPLVDKIAFTGSVEIGRRFLVFAGERSLHALDNYTHLKTTWVGL